MSESFEGLDVEVSSSNKLKEIRTRCVNYYELFLKQQKNELIQGCNTCTKYCKMKKSQSAKISGKSFMFETKGCQFSRHMLR